MAEQELSTTAKSTVPIKTIGIEQAGPCRKKIIVEIPQETVKKAADDQYESLRREALVPGFRKGRAPRRLLEKRFGKETSEQIKLKLLVDASDSAIKDNKLDVLRDAKIDHEKIELPAEGPFRFDFEVEVRPEFDLPALDGIPVEKMKLDVTDGDVDREIEAIRKYAGVWTPKEAGKVEPEDLVVADVLLNVEGLGEQKLDNTEIRVGPHGFVGGVPVEKLDELLIGAKSGDARQTSITVPKTYFQEEYRGKKVDIRIAIKDIKWLEPAELNEDFIRKCGASDADELRETIRQRLHIRRESQTRTAMTEQIYKYLSDKTSFDLPLDVVADQTIAVLRRKYADLLMQGLPRERIDPLIDRLKAGSEQEAKEQLKIFFIMTRVAEKLGIQTTEEEINGRIAQLALQRRQRPERLKDEMQKDGTLEQFKLQVREEKCVAKLLESAKITAVEPKPEPRPVKAKKPAEKTAKKAPAKAPAKATKTHEEQKHDKKPKRTVRKKKTEG